MSHHDEETGPCSDAADEIGALFEAIRDLAPRGSVIRRLAMIGVGLVDDLHSVDGQD